MEEDKIENFKTKMSLLHAVNALKFPSPPKPKEVPALSKAPPKAKEVILGKGKQVPSTSKAQQPKEVPSTSKAQPKPTSKAAAPDPKPKLPFPLMFNATYTDQKKDNPVTVILSNDFVAEYNHLNYWMGNSTSPNYPDFYLNIHGGGNVKLESEERPRYYLITQRVEQGWSFEDLFGAIWTEANGGTKSYLIKIFKVFHDIQRAKKESFHQSNLFQQPYFVKERGLINQEVSYAFKLGRESPTTSSSTLSSITNLQNKNTAETLINYFTDIVGKATLDQKDPIINMEIILLKKNILLNFKHIPKHPMLKTTVMDKIYFISRHVDLVNNYPNSKEDRDKGETLDVKISEYIEDLLQKAYSSQGKKLDLSWEQRVIEVLAEPGRQGVWTKYVQGAVNGDWRISEREWKYESTYEYLNFVRCIFVHKKFIREEEWDKLLNQIFPCILSAFYIALVHYDKIIRD